MPAFDNLSWLPSGDDFLNAIIAGGQMGMQREKLAQDADQFESSQQRSEPRGGGGTRMGGGGFDPLEQARTAAINNEQRRLDSQEAAKARQLELADNYMRHGDTPLQAYNRANLGQFGIPAPATERLTPSPWDTLNLGQGQVARVNSQTGAFQQLQPARPVAEKEATVSVPVFPEGTDPMMARFMGVSPTTYRGTAGAVSRALGDSAPATLMAPPQSTGVPPKDQLQVGQAYKTKLGWAVWNGESFEPVAAPAPNPFSGMGNLIGGSGGELQEVPAGGSMYMGP